jgi:hypothetical protein
LPWTFLFFFHSFKCIVCRIARQRLRNHVNACNVTSRNSRGKVFSVWSAPRNNRGAVFSGRGRYRKFITDWRTVTWIPKVQGKNNAARKIIKSLSLWRYVCWSTATLGVCNFVGLL